MFDYNRLVEEFMLLANMASARRVYNGFPHQALLRCHPPANNKKLVQAQKTLSQHDTIVDVSRLSWEIVNKMLYNNFSDFLNMRVFNISTMQCSGNSRVTPANSAG